MFVVNISNQGNVDAFFNFSDCKSVLFFWHSNTHHFASHLFQSMYLRHSAFNVACVGGSHRLDDNWCIAANCQVANMYLSSFPSHIFCVLPVNTSVFLSELVEGTRLTSPMYHIIYRNDNHQSQQYSHANEIDDPFSFWFQA